jgi:hypothetical protein
MWIWKIKTFIHEVVKGHGAIANAPRLDWSSHIWKASMQRKSGLMRDLFNNAQQMSPMSKCYRHLPPRQRKREYVWITGRVLKVTLRGRRWPIGDQLSHWRFARQSDVGEWWERWKRNDHITPHGQFSAAPEEPKWHIDNNRGHLSDWVRWASLWTQKFKQ